MKVSVPEEYFPLFESIGRRIRVGAGEFVFCESDVANDVYLVIKGRVQVYLGTEDGRQTTLEVLKSGRIFGDASFLEHSVRRANIVAVVDTELISCRMDDLIPVLSENAGLMIIMMQHLTSTCNYLTHTIRRLVSLTGEQKVADLLLSETDEKTSSISYTHGDVAECLAMHRVTVSRIMEKLKNEGVVDYSRGMIRVLDRKRLEKIMK